MKKYRASSCCSISAATPATSVATIAACAFLGKSFQTTGEAHAEAVGHHLLEALIPQAK